MLPNKAKAKVADEAEAKEVNESDDANEVDEANEVNDADEAGEANEADEIVQAAEADNSNKAIESDESKDADEVGVADEAKGDEADEVDETSLAGKVAVMSATCRPDSQKLALLADSAKSCRHKFVPDIFFVSGFADFLQIFSKYQRYIRSNHRTNWYVLNNPFSQVAFLHPSQYIIMVTARRATTTSTTQ